MPTSSKIKKCASQHFGPWAIEPGWWNNAIAAVKGGTWKAKADWDDDEDDGDGADPEPTYDLVNGIAIIRLRGHLTKGYSSFGGTSTVEVRRMIRNAANDYSVRGIMLQIDSPGGTCAGTADLAEDIKTADRIKPVFAYAEDLCCSAAYWAASQCRRIFSNVTGMVGCIGTYTVLEDSTGAQDLMGVKWKVVSTGRFKGLGADGKVTDDLVADVQREINELNAPFLAAVMAGRGRDEAWLQTVSDGRTWVGDNAKNLGLVDEVASFDAAMQALLQETSTMPTALDDFKAKHPDLYTAERDLIFKSARDEGHAAGKSEGKAEGAKAEKDRMAALSAAFPDRPAFTIQQFNDGADAPAAKAALADVLIEENKQLRQASADKAKKDEPKQEGVPFDGGTGSSQGMTDARREELLAATPAGRAVLAERRKASTK
jgi:signal peptide peptidase SppA